MRERGGKDLGDEPGDLAAQGYTSELHLPVDSVGAAGAMVGDAEENLVQLEILDASTRVTDADKVESVTIGSA